MKPFTLGKYIFVLMMMSLTILPTASGSLKAVTLGKKINEISILRAQIIDKIDQAVEMRYHLERRLADLSNEIHMEQERADIYSHPAALQNLRIRYNLGLIQTLQAYINLIDERIDYFRSGKERLKFLVDQINDDIAIIGILKDMEIENLIDRINLVLDEYIPEVQKQIFNAAHIRELPTEYVWESVSIKPNSFQFQIDTNASIIDLKMH